MNRLLLNARVLQALLALALCHAVPAMADSATHPPPQPRQPAYISPGVTGFILAWLSQR